jgi:ribosomal peptide maturation radical SAM protein 1
MAFGIKFVNMPFSRTDLPSIALTQLKCVTEAAHGERVKVDISYLNHEFGKLFGPQLYALLATSLTGFVTGLAEWLFRSVAFPEAPDNQAQFLTRYRHHMNSGHISRFREQILTYRARMPSIIDDLIARYKLDEAELVGFTSMFFQNLANIAVARRLKRINPKQIIVMGGANCEGTMGIELAANVPVLDYVFSGNSLISFPQLVGHLLDGNPDACQGIDGVFTRNNSRSIHEIVGEETNVDWSTLKPAMQLKGIGLMGRELDINADVPLDYDDFLDSAARLLPSSAEKPQVLFETSRGCWWGERAHCTFCGLNGGTMAYRAMAPDRALAMLRGLFARYASRVDTFASVDNIIPKEYIDGVFGRLKPPANVKLFYEVKADLKEEDVRTLAAGGVRDVQPGIEAFATSTLKLMRKGTTAFHGVRLLGYCKKYGIKPHWNLLIGFPGETSEVYEQYAKVLGTMFHLPPPQGAFLVRFDRYSPYFTFAKEYGLQLSPYDFYKLCYPFPRASLRNLAYYFQDLNYEAQYLRDVTPWVATLGGIIERWKGLWKQPEARPRLDWIRTPAGISVEDTREGHLRTHVLSIDAAQTLRTLREPERADRLTGPVDTALDELTRNALVFSERGKFLNLVSGVD